MPDNLTHPAILRALEDGGPYAEDLDDCARSDFWDGWPEYDEED